MAIDQEAREEKGGQVDKEFENGDAMAIGDSHVGRVTKLPRWMEGKNILVSK